MALDDVDEKDEMVIRMVALLAAAVVRAGAVSESDKVLRAARTYEAYIRGES